MIIKVSVVSNSRTPEVIKVSENSYRIKVDAAPSENKANKRLIEILSEFFQINKSSISIIKGLKSKNKIIEINL